MKKILLVYYSQTGQLTHLAENFVQSLEQAGVFVEKLAIKPQQEYPFPWRFMRFLTPSPKPSTSHRRRLSLCPFSTKYTIW